MIYSEIIQAKNGSLLPLFNSGKPMHSKYDPQKEAKQFVSSIEKKDFFIVLGLGGGYHIEELFSVFPESFFLIVEDSMESIEYLTKNLPLVKKLADNNKINICQAEDFSEILKKNYLPAIYSSLGIVEHKAWSLENPQLKDKIINIFSEELKNISADFSVQAHFGKLWTGNILKNLQIHDSDIKISIPSDKTALVVAAGPTLDSKIQYIKDSRKDFFIIATDTAYKILLRQNIYVDAVFSVDGQLVSINHFNKRQADLPLFIFELTANYSCTTHLKEAGGKILFTYSGHPFEILAKDFSSDSLFYSNSSSGTVTIAALDFAIRTGFKDIQIIAADFSYFNGKSYSSGSYLDDIYSNSQKKTENQETSFSRLMYRTELIKNNENRLTTQILDSYHSAFLNWISSNKAVFEKKDDIYYVSCKEIFFQKEIEQKKFDFYGFAKELKKHINILLNETKEVQFENPLIISLLPLISYYKFKDFSKPELKSFDEYLKLALNFVLRYT